MANTAIAEKGKWAELGKKLEVIVFENQTGNAGKKKTMKKIFEDFAKEYDTTSASAQNYYYTELKAKIEEKTKKLNNSLDKHIETVSNIKADPIYRDVRQVHRVGSIAECTVVAIKDFGAFVKSTEGYDGLIHISEITSKEYVTMPEDFFYVGERVKAKVIRLEGERLNLSIREIKSKEKINPAFKGLSEIKDAEPAPKVVPVKPLIPKKVVPPKVSPPEKKVAPKAVPVAAAEVQKKTQAPPMNDKDNIIQFIKRYSDNNVSKQALLDIEEMIEKFGVFQTTISLMETVRDLDISSFITDMTKEKLDGDYLRRP